MKNNQIRSAVLIVFQCLPCFVSTKSDQSICVELLLFYACIAIDYLKHNMGGTFWYFFFFNTNYVQLFWLSESVNL